MDAIWMIAVILVMLWLVGFFALPGVGAFIHILLVIAVIVIVYRLLIERKILTRDKRWHSQNGWHPIQPNAYNVVRTSPVTTW